MSSLKKKSSWHNENGFSLIDVVVTVAIIVALSVGGFVSYNGLITNAKRAAVGAAADQVFTAVRVAESDGNSATDSDSVKTNYEASTADIRVDITGSGDTLSVIATNVASPGIRAMRGAEGSVAPPATPIVARTNLALNPGFESGAANDSSVTGSGTPLVGTVIPAAAHSGGYGFRKVSTTAGQAMGWGWHSAVVPVGRYKASFWVRSNVSRGFNVFVEGSATKTFSRVGGNTFTMAPNTWQKLELTIDVTAPGTIKVAAHGNANAAGEMMDYDEALVEAGNETGTYFDGITSGQTIDGVAYSYSWTGTPNASTSVATYLPPSE